MKACDHKGLYTFMYTNSYKLRQDR